MNTVTEAEKGWKPIPLPLKILSALFVLWSIGAIMNLPNLLENGLPLFGNFVYGATAIFVVLLLDIIGPMGFLFALWQRKPWGVIWAFTYIGLFILNSVIAFVAVREQLGVPQILVPAIVSAVFIAVIFWKRHYFEKAGKPDSAA